MKNSIFLVFTVCCTLCSVLCSAQSRNSAYEAYIAQYKDIAIMQMLTAHIPASITLAQALLESGAGTSTLAVKANNHFGIKCTSDWTGATLRHDDDARGERFRAYNSVEESYDDHSRFLAKHPRYASLFTLPLNDYKGWAHGLKKAGYATNPHYAERLINLIELYDLQQYDGQQAYRAVTTTTANPTQSQQRVDDNAPFSYTTLRSANHHEPHAYLANGLVYIVVQQHQTVASIAKEWHISERKLLKYNELYGNYRPREGDIIYLQKKHQRAVKAYVWHVVEPGESMHRIAQRYGMKLKTLYKLNQKSADYVPQVGDMLRLR